MLRVSSFFLSVVGLCVVLGQPCPNPIRRVVVLDGATGIGVRAYSTDDINIPHPQVTRAVVVTHGAGRNGDEYFCWMYESFETEYPNGNPEVFIIGLNFLIASDNPASNELYWTEPGWKTGYDSLNPQLSVSSFEVMDFLIEGKFQNPNLFPNLRQITLPGHSAGGQYMNRYSQGSHVQPRIPVRYIPSNPSSWAYLNEYRPFPSTLDLFTLPTNPPATYDSYIYGLNDMSRYMEEIGKDRIIAQFPPRDVVYLMGMNDTCSDVPINQCHPYCTDPNCSAYGLDKSPSAMLQGPVRFLRGQAFFNYLEFYYGRQIHKFVPVHGITHSGENMFKSYEGRQAIFH